MFYRQANFSDEIYRQTDRREVWDFMIEMQKECSFLNKLLHALTWEIRKQRRGIKNVWD